MVGFLRAVRRPLEGAFRAFDGVRPEGLFSCLYEALALECLYRKEPARAGELLSSALDGAADARTRARLLLEILMAERARGGNKAFLQRADGIRGLMSSSAFLPALEEWLARVAPPPAPPKK